MKKIIVLAASFWLFKYGYAQLGEFDSVLNLNNTSLAASVLGTPTTLPDVKYHLTARPWQALNVSRDDYLYRVEGIVREIAKLQNTAGAIIDPYANREVQYSTPYFANAVGTLISAGRAMDLLDKGVAAMNSATADVAAGKNSIPDNHGEFFIAPLASAIPIYTPFVSASQLKIWKDRMAKPVADVIQGLTHNWRTYAMKGEWYRAKYGYVNMDTAMAWLENSWITTQKNRFTDNSWNFYHDKTSDPDTWPYESVARSNLLFMIDAGYNGTSRTEILGMLKKGTQASLLLQDPSGQGISGGRSGNHTWNDIVLANGYETMAEIAFREGKTRMAGQYRHAAGLAFQSVQRWRNTGGTYSVTKNHFDPKYRIRYATYSFFTNYNGYMMYHMAENYLKHKTTIAEQPSPNEIGGYTIASDGQFATAVANAGGMHMEMCLRGSTSIFRGQYWTTLGVVRFARPGWDSRLGPADGVRETSSNLGISFAPTFFENDKWVRLASIPDRYEAVFTTQFTHPLLVRCRVEYKPKTGKTGPTFINDFVITPDVIKSTLTSSSSNFGVTWPLLTFDGAAILKTALTSHIASTSYSSGADQQNFIALHSSPTIIATDSVRRSSYGDLRPVRMVSGTASNVTLIYPRNFVDPSAETVRKTYVSSGGDFSTVLGKVEGNIYVGRNTAGGVGTSIDVNDDGKPDATFNTITGFVMQMKLGQIINVETDKDVTGIIHGQTFNLKAYTPVTVLQTLNPAPPLNTAMGHLARAQAFADKSSYPRSTNTDGTIKRVTASDWTSGFFPGSLWLMYEFTKDSIWRTRAEQWTAVLENQKNNTSTHDVGFKLNCSFGAGYRLTGNEKYKAVLLQGAKSLASRFNTTVGCIKSWNNTNYTFPVIIDNMMNLELLFLATKLSGDSSYFKIAVKHALTTINNHFRLDNSSYHVVDYNPTNGSVISKSTFQGLNDSSDWARGQAWGLYGFTMCYRETGDTRFLTMAKNIADFYISHPNMPADRVAFWDFDAFNYRDASNACIAGSALLELSQFVPEKRTTYYNFGIKILQTVSSSAYIAAVGTNNDFVLKHSVGNKPANIEVDKPAIYTDYYFIEALLRLKKPAPILKVTGGNYQVSLKWNYSTGARYYSIKRSTISGGPYTTIVANTTSISYTNSGLSPGKTYYYTVTPWNAMGEGGTSAEAKATTNAAAMVNVSNPADHANYCWRANIKLNSAYATTDD